MARFSSRRGFDLRLPGAAPSTAEPGPPPASVAVSATAHAGLKARALVEAGQRVRAGEALFAPRRDPGAVFVAPLDGTVTEVREGARRRLLAVVLRPEAGVAPSWPGGEAPGADGADAWPVETLRRRLQAAGLWPVLRERPGERLPATDATPDAVFVTAIETEPLSPVPGPAIAAEAGAFLAGVSALARFAPGRTWVCVADPPGFDIGRLPEVARLATFAGPHPAGLPGTHIARLAPLVPGRTAWHVGWQDCLAIGRWLRTGQVDGGRLVAVGGPGAAPPRLLRTVRGIRVADLLREGERAGPAIAGSPWSGRAAVGTREHLDAFDRVVTLAGAAPVRAGGHRWLGTLPPRAKGMLGGDALDRAWPLDVPVTPLLRALMVGDEDTAIALGALDLAEEDLALVTALGAGGHDFGGYLRRLLDAAAGGGSP